MKKLVTVSVLMDVNNISDEKIQSIIQDELNLRFQEILFDYDVSIGEISVQVLNYGEDKEENL